MKYRVVYPNAGIVSRHHKLIRAIEAVQHNNRKSLQQGGRAEYHIEYWDKSAGAWLSWREPEIMHYEADPFFGSG